MGITVEPLHPLFVAQVTGVDLRAPVPAAVFAEIAAAFSAHAVLVFPDQPITNQEQISFTQLFGPIETAPNYAGDKLRLPQEFTDISNLDKDGNILDPKDRLNRYNLGNQMWHTDSSFKARRAKCSLLSAREITAEGGETQYADMRSAYDALSERVKGEIEDLVALHSIAHSRKKSGFEDFNEDITTSLPPVPQKLVGHFQHSGRSSLYLASHASHILGWPVARGQALLQELTEHATQEKFVYTQKWAIGDLVIWDNRCTMHRGRPYDPNQRRVLHRTTVSDIETAFDPVDQQSAAKMDGK